MSSGGTPWVKQNHVGLVRANHLKVNFLGVLEKVTRSFLTIHGLNELGVIVKIFFYFFLIPGRGTVAKAPLVATWNLNYEHTHIRVAYT